MPKHRSRDQYKGVIVGDLNSDLPMQAQHSAHSINANSPVNLSNIAPGQRWVVETEPELGLGIINEIKNKRALLAFHNNSTTRQYSLDIAPLRRIVFKEGDKIRTRDGLEYCVDKIVENDRLITYVCGSKSIIESQLSDTMQLHTPLQLLLNAVPDNLQSFSLRQEAVALRKHSKSSKIRGFSGPRIDLIPHQMYIAHAICSRFVSRAFLADEVGLGKTIEACLILHNLLVRGRAHRALILVPAPLLHVWFVELLRKFNIKSVILDERMYEERKSFNDINPFLRDPIILTSIDFLLTNQEDFVTQVPKADWDMLILDEAHNVIEGSEEFDLVQKIAKNCKDILFLTATPQQKGDKNYFALLRILDPHKYANYNHYLREAKTHIKIANILEDLQKDIPIEKSSIDELSSVFPKSRDVLEKIVSNSYKTKLESLIEELLDRIGIGRALFRNTRVSVGGFPKRIVQFLPMKVNTQTTNQIVQEYHIDTTKNQTKKYQFKNDPRVEYIIDFLQKNKKEKLLIICRTQEKVEALKKAFSKLVSIDISTFHEGLSIIQRDRNAAWFAREDGSRVLICSEIGSEGRNFQFAHHLFLFDLPLNPELIEQRIGRVDRIGQKNDVSIHIPCIKNTPLEIIARWMHEGIGIFKDTNSAVYEVYTHFKEKLISLIELLIAGDKNWVESLNELIKKTKIKTGEVSERLESGRDYLLEQNSFRPHITKGVVESIQKEDADVNLENFMTDFFEQNGVFNEPIGFRTYKLWGTGIEDDLISGISKKRPLITFDRSTALSREDIEFLTFDHPAVQSGIEMLLGSTSGTHTFAKWKNKGQVQLLLEANFILEAVAPPIFMVDRFLPPTPIKVIVNHKFEEQNQLYKSQAFKIEPEECGNLEILDKPNIKEAIIPKMYNSAETIAQDKAIAIINNATKNMKSTLNYEIKRIKALSENITESDLEEIGRAKAEIDQLTKVISQAIPRTDSLRLIMTS